MLSEQLENTQQSIIMNIIINKKSIKFILNNSPDCFFELD